MRRGSFYLSIKKPYWLLFTWPSWQPILNHETSKLSDTLYHKIVTFTILSLCLNLSDSVESDDTFSTDNFVLRKLCLTPQGYYGLFQYLLVKQTSLCLTLQRFWFSFRAMLYRATLCRESSNLQTYSDRFALQTKVKYFH